MGVLDNAIAQLGPRRTSSSRRFDRLVDQLIAAAPPDDDSPTRLPAILVERDGDNWRWTHAEMLAIVKDCCQQLDVNTDDAVRFNYKDVEDYRKTLPT